MARMPAPLTVASLTELIDIGDVDTVLVVFTDMQGRLQGKRIHGRFFLDEVLKHGTEACDYLLAVDIEMRPHSGYSMSSWEKGYGDFVLRPDLATLRPTPWLEATAMVQCDLLWPDGSPVLQSPRQILLRQLDLAIEAGYMPYAGTELEFVVFNNTYESAWDSGYTDLVPSNRYNVDYSILGGSRVEPLLRDIRNQLSVAGLTVESAKGECNPGQHEIAIKYDEIVITADQHAVYKMAAKELAATHQKALTFMAKYNELEGNSCHIHMSLRGVANNAMVFAENPDGSPANNGRSELFRSFVAGVLGTMAEFTLLYAPNINSYKRYQRGSFAPTAIAWGDDNRTCAVRVVGHGESLRMENRVPGGDANPYLALAAMLAGGLYGVRQNWPLEDPLEGNAYAGDLPRVPTTLKDARHLFKSSEIAKEVFGEEVVEHYAHAAQVEIEAFEAAPTPRSGHGSAITTWELFRGFERM